MDSRQISAMASGMQADFDRLSAEQGAEQDTEVELRAIDRPAGPVSALDPDWKAYFVNLTVGVQVEYVLKDGQIRPAIVVQKWTSEPGDKVNLCVFMDGSNDTGNVPPGGALKGDGMLYWATSVHYAPPEDAVPGTWHYMDELEDYEEDETATIIDDQG